MTWHSLDASEKGRVIDAFGQRWHGVEGWLWGVLAY